MVKVYKCHNFKSQSVVQVDGEPVAFYNNRHSLFIATNRCTIEVFSLKSPIKRICCFSTESTVHDIVYCYPGNYVATIESKHSRRKEFYSVKVYLNWEIATSKQKTSIQVRIAGNDHMVKSSSIEDTHLQVIDLNVPEKDKIESIDVCQKTGNLIVVCREYTFLYHLIEKTIVNSNKSYLDVILFLKLEWHIGNITKTVLCEDFIGVLSKNDVQVVKVIYSDENVGGVRNVPVEINEFSGKRLENHLQKPPSVVSNVSKSSLSLPETPQFSKIGCRGSTNASPSVSLSKSFDSNSCIKEDRHFTKINLDDIKSYQGQHSNKCIKTIHLQNLEKNITDKCLEPTVDDLRGGSHVTVGQIQVVTVHHQKSKRTDEAWQHIQLIPTYMSNVSKLPTRTGSGSVPLRSTVYNSLVGICCFVSTDSNGYLFDILSSSQSLLSVYTYSDIPKQIFMTQELLYVLTGRGLEIYTSRCGTAAIHHTERFNTKDKAFPPADMETCLCGVHLFMNAVKLDVSDNYVIILSRTDSSQRSVDNEWCLYAIEKCSATELYKDMVKYGEKSRKTNEATYLNLLLEGHMALRNTFIGGDMSDEEIENAFRESCVLIGEYYARDNSKDRYLCIPYLAMSGLSVADVIRQQITDLDKIDTQEYGHGFIGYLKYILLLDGEPFDLIEAEGDMILSVCRKAIPDQLSEVILFSRVKDYSNEHALSLMQSWIKELSSHGEKSSATDKLAFSYLYLTLCDPEVAENSLSMMCEADLVKLCTEHHQLLHDNFQQLSPLSQLMRRCCPSVLTKSLVSLHDKGTVSLDMAIQLLQGTSRHEEMYKNTHVKEYLELLLNDIQRRYIFDEAVVILSEIYIRRLREHKFFTSKQRTSQQYLQLPGDKGHFGRRYNWLDNLPPFKGPDDMKQPCQHILRSSPTEARRVASSVKHSTPGDFCHCALCFEDLIKLQSLLCSSNASEMFIKKLHEILTTEELVPGQDSLLILILMKTDKQKATHMLVEKYPGSIMEFSKCVMSTDAEQRKLVLDCLYSSLEKQTENPDEKELVYLQALNDVLHFLAKNTDPEEFLQLLPDNGDLLYFLPYISTNLQQQKTHQLLQTIKEKGSQLQLASV